MGKDRYSITAYEVKIASRMRGVKGKSLEDLQDCQKYIDYPFELLNDFINNNLQNDINFRDRFFMLKETQNDSLTFANKISLDVRYGYKTGIDFSVYDGLEDKSFSKEAKIIKPYCIYFFIDKDRMYFLAFRNGQYSCKTAVESEMKKLLADTNIMVSFDPVANNEYIRTHFADADISALQYEIVYSADSGDLSTNPKTEKQKFSSISIDMTSHQNKKKFDLRRFLDLFTGTVRKEIITKAGMSVHTENDTEIDEDSFKVEILMNKTKRLIRLNQLESLLFDVDITESVKENEQGNPDMKSVNEIIDEYMKGILKHDK